MLLMRKVAQAASVGYVKSADFLKFWPVPEGLIGEYQEKVWGDKEETLKLREQIQQKHGIKLG